MPEFIGTGAADTLTGGAAADTVSGFDGADRLVGGGGGDIIYGHGASDALFQGGRIDAVQIATGLTGSLFLASAPGDPGFVYVVQKSGEILRLDAQTGAGTTFLDIPDADIGNIGEGGLLGLAFHPSYDSNGRFFVFVSNPAGDIEIRSYQRAAGSPPTADQASKQVLLTVPHPTYETHYGGWIGFGPDGLLYVATGDGGSPANSAGTAQSLDSLLGKILRIDIDSDGFPGDPARNYAIPVGNPFAGATPGADEVWAYGLRNPWRNSFDNATGNLYIADVGQSRVEEINFEAAGLGGGRNYGWPFFEGNLPFGSGTPPGGLTAPIHTYDHDVGVSVTGGYVYRGSMPGAQGHYVFADFSAGIFWTLRMQDGAAVDVVDRTAQIEGLGAFNAITSFGTDSNGALYVMNFGGRLVRLDPTTGAGDAGDTILGDAGNDSLYGGAGGDTIDGGSDNDLIKGGYGNDRLSGGSGSDTAVFDAAREDIFIYSVKSGGQIVTRLVDATSGENDQIDGIETLSFDGATFALRGASLNRWSNVVGSRFDDVVFHNDATGVTAASIMSGGNVNGSGPLTSANGPLWDAIDSADINSDGIADVVYRDTSDGSFAIGFMSALGVTGYSFITQSLSTTWRLVGTGDWEGDGDVDLMVQNDVNGLTLRAQMENGAFSSWVGYLTVRSPVPSDNRQWEGRAVGDFNGDGIDEVFFQIVAGLTVPPTLGDIYAEGLGVAPSSFKGLLNGLPGWRLKEAADVNGDGFDDLIVQNETTGNISYANMANGVFSGWGTIVNGLGPTWQLESMADTNNDGDADAIIRDIAGTGTTYAVNMENGAFQGFTLIAQNIGADWYVV